MLYGQPRKHPGQVLREPAIRKESLVVGGHPTADHVHMLIAVPPKYAVSRVVGFIKGKSAIHIAGTYAGGKQNFTGQHFWAGGYYVSTAGRDEETVREYIRRQEAEDQRPDRLNMFK